MIRGEDFVYYGPEGWQSMWRNRHQLLSRLARANWVVYVEPRPYIEQIAAALRAGELHVADLSRDRGLCPALPGAHTLLQNEEHLVLHTPQAPHLQPGDELLAIPYHVCPTSALHRQAVVVDAGKVVARWDVRARDRRLTI